MPLRHILKFNKFCLKNLLLIVLLCSVSCLKNPQADYDNLYEADNVEFESVCQYLKAFSIYQDSSIYEGRIPENPFDYQSIEEMFFQIADTIRVNENCRLFTRYYYEELNWSASDDDNIRRSASVESDVIGNDVYYYNVTESTGIIKIETFLGIGIYQQFLECVSQIPSTNKNLIIDLRNNSGGSIPEADSIIESFLPAGKEYIMARERNLEYGSEAATLDWHPWVTGRSAHNKLKDKKLIVWMDKNTASASEILAVALADCASAVLVGTRSFGKGIGQVVIDRNNRDAIQITYLQLRGISDKTGSYHGVGIKPDIETNYLTEIVRLVEPSYNGGYIDYNNLMAKNNSQSYSYNLSSRKSFEPLGYKIIYEDSILGK